MTNVKVKLVQQDSPAHVTVELSVVKSEQFRLLSKIDERLEHLRLSDGSVISTEAKAAAAFSGAIYAVGQIRGETYTITIKTVCGQISTADLTVCAVATSTGVIYATGHQDIVPVSNLYHWSLASCTIDGCLIALQY